MVEGRHRRLGQSAFLYRPVSAVAVSGAKGLVQGGAAAESCGGGDLLTQGLWGSGDAE